MVKKTNSESPEFSSVRTRYASLISSIFAMLLFHSSGNRVVSNVLVYVSCQFILISQSHLCPAIKYYLYVQELLEERNPVLVY